MIKENQRQFIFVILSCIFSVLHAIGYTWHGIQLGFNHCIMAMIICDLIFIPSVLCKRGNLLYYYLIVYSFILVIILAFTDSRLYNNYSSLLCIFTCILLFPQRKYFLMGVYLFNVSIGFILNGAPSYYMIIHTSRALWIFTIYDVIIYNRYNRKPVILLDDEQKILEQLTDNKLLKEIELNGMSERTIRRRLDAAKKRNGLQSTEELKALYTDTYKNGR